MIHRPGARHDVTCGTCLYGLLSWKNLRDEILQPLRRIDVVRENDRGGPEQLIRATGRIAKIVDRVGAEIDRPGGKTGPVAHSAAVHASDDRGSYCAGPAGNDPVID